MSELKGKLLAVQTKLKAPKDLRNNYGGYNYRSVESILEALKPLLKEEGLTLELSDELVHLGDRYYVKATATLRYEQEFTETCGYAREEETKKGMDASQITGASSSYARKYALNGMFLIDDTKDSDATNKHNKKDIPLSPEKQKALKQFEEFSGTDLIIGITEYNKRKKGNINAVTARDLVAQLDLPALRELYAFIKELAP